MIGVSAGPILPAFGPVPTAVDMPVGVLRRKPDCKKKKKKKIDVKLDGHPANALVDQQTTGASLISSTYISTYNLPIVELPKDVTVNLALQGSRGKSTHYVIANLDIGGHTQPVTFSVVACKSTVFYRTPAPIIVYYFPYITCLLYLLFLIKHVRTSG